jgi:hypothetical protein
VVDAVKIPPSIAVTGAGGGHDTDQYLASAGLSLPTEQNEAPIADPLPTCSVLDLKSANIMRVFFGVGDDAAYLAVTCEWWV